MEAENNPCAETKKHARKVKRKTRVFGKSAIDLQAFPGMKKVRLKVGIIEEYSVLDCAARLRNALIGKGLFCRQTAKMPIACGAESEAGGRGEKR